MKKIIVFLTLFISSISIFGVTGCFNESENPLLFEEVMQGRSPETLNDSANNQTSNVSQDPVESDEPSQLYAKPSLFEDSDSLISGYGVIVAWDEDGYMTISRTVEDPDTGNSTLETYKINYIGDSSEYEPLPADIYCGKVNVKGYDFTIVLDKSANMLIKDSTGNDLFFGMNSNYWQLGENRVANGSITQEQLDAAKTILEKIE